MGWVGRAAGMSDLMWWILAVMRRFDDGARVEERLYRC